MYEMKEKTKNLCEINEKISELMLTIMCSNPNSVNLEQAGMLIDMIKDLWESEKNAWKSCYYKKMVEGMEPPTEEELKEYMHGPMGYDNWRFKSGKFAPTGRGHFAGYMMDEEIYGPENDMMYGYRSGDGSPSGGMGTRRPYEMNPSGYSHNPMRDRYGRAYAEWDDARKHYTQTNSKEDKDKMDMHAKESMRDAMASMKELWKGGDTELRKEIKKDLTALISEMPV